MPDECLVICLVLVDIVMAISASATVSSFVSLSSLAINNDDDDVDDEHLSTSTVGQ